MKIGIDLRSLQGEERAGIGRYVYQLCESLLQLDKDNEYFFYFNSAQHMDYPEFTKRGTIIHNRIPSKLFKLTTIFFNYPTWGNKQKLDLFWQPSFDFVNLSRKVSRVLTVHDLSWLINKDWYSYKMILWHRLQKASKHIILADSIVAVSKSTAADLQYFFNIDKKKISVVSSGINREVFDSVDCKLIGLPDNYILYIGAIEPRKNILGILQALERIYTKYNEHKDVHFVIMGASGWSNRKVHKAMEKSKYSDNFHYVGYTTNKQRDCYIRNAKALVWPSFYEGFGHPPLEALWRNKQVITGHGSSLPEVVKNNAILIDPYNISDISEAILQVLKNTSIACDSQKSTDCFRWDEAATEYLNIFNSLKK